MFVVSIGDGLGNQMFHYAFYYSLCKKYNKNLVLLDNYLYGNDNKHNGIEIDKIFSIELKYCSKLKALSLCDYHPCLKKSHIFLSLFWGIRQVIFGAKCSLITVDDPTVFYDEIYELDKIKSYYLRGNWVNPKYFSDYRNDLIRIFKFPKITDSDNLLLLDKIKTTNSISIHIRAGDYLKSSTWTLPDNYYEKAVSLLLKLLKERNEYDSRDIVFFVFSDDVNFAKKKLNFLENTYFVDNNRGADSYKDMYLISMCNHNIIANSTFSFWGAYLNCNNSKIVISPEMFNSSFRNPLSCDDWYVI